MLPRYFFADRSTNCPIRICLNDSLPLLPKDGYDFSIVALNPRWRQGITREKREEYFCSLV